MMNRVVVVAPHPDDETLGCGGTILKHKMSGDAIYWLIVTAMVEDAGYSPVTIEARAREIEKVGQLYDFNSIVQCGFPATRLDTLPIEQIIKRISHFFKEIEPDIVYVPSKSDVHTDHRVVCDAVAACTKWFRCISVKRILAYETLSETDLGFESDCRFNPNYFVNIENSFTRKLEAMAIYQSELADFPFPRSFEAMHALASLRGTASGFKCAEAFELLREKCY